MRRKKSTFALLLTLTTLLSSCKKSEDYIYPGTNWKDNVVVYVGGKEYKYKDIYSLFDGKKESASAYYSIAKNVLIQLVTERNTSMQDIVDGKMEDYREQWSTNSKNNNTSYEDERKKTLDSEGVLDEEALENKLYLAEQTTSNENSYLKENTGANDYSYYINEETTKTYVKDNAPYHVSHILIKVDASSDGTGRYDGKISSDDANQIGNLVKNLISNDSFGSVAQQLSDDTGSAKNHGELADSSNGVAMEKRTSYINEFKLGIYAYDAFINKDTSEGDINTTLKKSLRVPGQVQDDNSQSDAVEETIKNTDIYQNKVYGIPLSVALTMNVISSKEKSDFGTKPSNTSETQYPRNIYFNNYFNQHSVSLIYDDSEDYDKNFLNDVIASYGGQTGYTKDDLKYISKAQAKAAGEDENKTIEAKLPTRYDEYNTVKTLLDTYTKDQSDGSIYRKKFKSFDSISNSKSTLVSYSGTIEQNTSTNKYYAKNTTQTIGRNKNILTDERGNPVLIVRGGSDSYQGLHFITVNKDPFVDADNSYKYWTTTLPDASKTGDAYSSNYSKNPTFINFVTDSTSAKTTYKERANWIKNDIKAANSSLQEYNLWSYNLNKFQEKYNANFLDLLGDNKNIVVDYVDSQIKGTNKSSSDTLDSSWESYINLLDVTSTIQKRGIIPTVCVGYFNRGSYSVKEGSGDDAKDTNKGEGCHVTI